MGADMAEENASGTAFSEKAVEDLKNISPLALPEYIAECEFYDETETRKVLDDVVKEFEKDGGTVDAVLKPVMYSVADGLLEAIPGGAAMRRKGLTPQRIVSECEAFTYSSEGAGIGAIPGVAYVDFKNARGYREGELDWGKVRKNGFRSEDVYSGGFAQHSGRRYKHHRDNYDDVRARKAYADSKAGEVSGKNLQDEYTGRKDIWLNETNPDRRYRFGDRTEARRHVANVDHIVPLKEIQKELAGNYALSRKDIKTIANTDANYALVNSQLNKSKGAKSNAQYVKEHPELDQATKERMLAKDKEAREALWGSLGKLGKINDTVLGNLTDGGAKGRLVRKRAVGKAANQAKDYAVGNVVLYLLKPLYWELKDSFKNGFRNGVNADSGMAAIRIRFGRIKSYLVAHAKEFLGDSVWEFIKGFVSSLIEGIIGLFVGMFRSVLKLIKEGIRIFIQAAKILWGKNAAKMTPAEKGDAIVKLIGASVASLAGIGVEALLSSIGTPKLLRVPLATMLSGIASAVFMYLLDKADLFGVKSDKRYARVKEIFEARITDMKADTAKFEVAVSERLRANWIEYACLNQRVNDAFDRHDIKAVDGVLQQMANYFRVTLPYEDSQSFVKFVKGNANIQIDDTTVIVA